MIPFSRLLKYFKDFINSMQSWVLNIFGVCFVGTTKILSTTLDGADFVTVKNIMEAIFSSKMLLYDVCFEMTFCNTICTTEIKTWIKLNFTTSNFYL